MASGALKSFIVFSLTGFLLSALSYWSISQNWEEKSHHHQTECVINQCHVEKKICTSYEKYFRCGPKNENWCAYHKPIHKNWVCYAAQINYTLSLDYDIYR